MVKVYVILVLAVIAGAAVPGLAKGKRDLDPNQPLQGAKSNAVTYQVDFSAVVTPPYKCKVLKIWMPIPPSDEAQQVSDSRLSTFPQKVPAKIGQDKLYGNRFAYFEFKEPEGAQIVRHQFTIKTWEVNWNVDLGKVERPKEWPAGFAPFLRSERLIPVDDRFRQVALSIDKEPSGQSIFKVIDWVNGYLVYSHQEGSLQGSAVHALEKKTGHCSDYHGLCSALGRCLGFPTRIAYGINPYPKNSPSHCKLEVFLPPYGWVCFDVSDTQNLIGRIDKEKSFDAAQKTILMAAATKRLQQGFRDNTWYAQTRGSDYDLEPPAKNRVAVVRTIYAEADGEPLPEPDPANPKQRAFSWMTIHHYVPDRAVTSPFLDWKTLQK